MGGQASPALNQRRGKSAAAQYHAEQAQGTTLCSRAGVAAPLPGDNGCAIADLAADTNIAWLDVHVRFCVVGPRGQRPCSARKGQQWLVSTCLAALEAQQQRLPSKKVAGKGVQVREGKEGAHERRHEQH